MLRRFIFAIALMSVATLSFAEAVRISGFVSGSANGTKFTLGSSKGRFTVETSGAKVSLNGRTFDVSKLTGGSQVTVEGELTGKNLRAKTVVVGNLRGSQQPPVKPTSDPRKPQTPAAGSAKAKPKGKRDDMPVEAKPTDKKRGPMPVIGKFKPADKPPKATTGSTAKTKPAEKKSTPKVKRTGSSADQPGSKSTSDPRKKPTASSSKKSSSDTAPAKPVEKSKSKAPSTAKSKPKTEPKTSKPAEKPTAKPAAKPPTPPSRSDGR